MPWWGFLYLLILVLLGIAGTIEQLRSKQTYHGLFTLFSLCTIGVLIWAYYNPDFGAMLGYWSLPLIVAAGLYDWWLANLDLQPDSETFLKPLPDAKSKLTDMSASLIILPAYLAGAMVCYRVFTNG